MDLGLLNEISVQGDRETLNKTKASLNNFLASFLSSDYAALPSMYVSQISQKEIKARNRIRYKLPWMKEKLENFWNVNTKIFFL